MKQLLIVLGLGVATLVPAPAAAQSDDKGPASWGVAVAFAPNWSVPTGDHLLGDLARAWHRPDDGGVLVDGADFRIGVTRGRPKTGEWGASFVRRSFKDGSKQGGVETDCEGNTCFSFGEEYFYQDVSMTGIEVNKFVSFVQIKNVVQIGMDFAGGVGWMQGTAEYRTTDTDFTFVNNQPVTKVVVTSEDVEAKELYINDPTFLGRVEIAVAVKLPAGFKARVSGGMNFPGSHVLSVTAMYFFGRP